MDGLWRWVTTGIGIGCLVVGWACAEHRDSTDGEQLPRSGSTTMDVETKEDGLVEGPATFEEFLDYVYCESDGRVCVVDGDTPVTGGLEGLREFYDQHVDPDREGLVVNRRERGDDLWYGDRRFELDFCVGDQFGDRHDEVVEATVGAAEDWEAVAAVEFRYLDDQDDRCGLDNSRVVFPVLPAEDEAPYLARAFFPEFDDHERDVRVHLPNVDASMATRPELTLRGLMRHELGHVLGFRHEHTRQEADAPRCFEDFNYRPATEYDARSVMHYPQCGGEAGWSLQITDRDAEGAAYLYPEEGLEVLGRCDEELDGIDVDETCEPVVDQITRWLSEHGEPEVLDDWMGLREGVRDPIAEGRLEEPFEDFDDLRERAGMNRYDLRDAYDYLFVWGRCPGAEVDDRGWVRPSCYPVVNRILELVNEASRDKLDDQVGLDERGVDNIVDARADGRIESYEQLISLGWVKRRALMKMYEYLYDES